MKRWMVRLAALSTVVLGGLILFAHAYHDPQTSEQDGTSAKAKEPSDALVRPIPIAMESEPSATSSNLFANRSRLLDKSEANEPAPPRYAETSSYREQVVEEPVDTQEPARLIAPEEATEMPTPRHPFRAAAEGAAVGRYADQEVERAAAGIAETAPQESIVEEPIAKSEEVGPSAALTGGAEEPTLADEPQETPVAPASRYGQRADIASAAGERPYARRSPFGESAETPVIENAFAPPAGRAARSTSSAGGRPGDRKLEGSQSPSLVIEKSAPAEIQVNKPATFSIRVRNVGQVAANDVEIHDQIPQGTQLISTKPSARDDGGQLVWELGAMKPGDERTVEMEVTPTTEGDIGSVASVTFRAEASARARATRPQLKLEASAPAKVLIGETVMLKIHISNPGTGPATGVVLTEKVPPGFKHEGGSELEFEVGTLAPGESRDLELALVAAQPGTVTNMLSAVGDADLQAQETDDIEVIAPAIKLSVDGPKRRFLQRNATHNITVANPGTSVAKNVELLVTLPRGLKFVEANNEGHYDATAHSVLWSLAELPAGETGTVTLTTLAVEAGDLKLQVAGKAAMNLSDALEEEIAVEGVAAIFFELVDVNDPIEVGGETSYEIRVINQGSAAATNVQLVALLPPELKALDASGPVQHTLEPGRVLFEPLSQLAPKADTMYTLKVQGKAAGDLRLRVQVVTDQITNPVTKEESTRVYSDE